jgi:hypothetical protein
VSDAFPPDPPEVDGPGEPAPGPEQIRQDANVEPAVDTGAAAEAAAPVDSFTSGEKIRSLLDLVMNAPPPDARTRSAVAAIKTAHRFRLLRPILDTFPPLDEPGEWDEWIAVAVGVALNLVSDGVEVDVDELERHGALVLASLFEAAEGHAGAGR